MTKIARAGLADFLKTRRARLRPEQFGLPTFPGRRTPGLRREELAQLVGVGVSWYTWLEQGRDIQVSHQVLERLVAILQLNKEERRHLFLLARGQTLQPDEQGGTSSTQHTTYQSILDGFIYPARIYDQHLNIVAWNESANRALYDHANRTERERNTVWSMFMNPFLREFIVDWEHAAQRCVAFLRAKSDQYTEEAWLQELIADLQYTSPEFRAWWPRHEILLACNAGPQDLNHPLVGRLTLQPTMLSVPAQPDWQLVVYTPIGNTADRLKALLDETGYSL